jgi:hypothetical protein
MMIRRPTTRTCELHAHAVMLPERRRGSDIARQQRLAVGQSRLDGCKRGPARYRNLRSYIFFPALSGIASLGAARAALFLASPRLSPPAFILTMCASR